MIRKIKFLFLINNKKTYDSNVYNIACENLFYDIKNASANNERQIFEKTFGEMETTFVVLLKMFIRRC